MKGDFSLVDLKTKFDDHFFEEEDRFGFHVDRNRKEIWAVELDLLLEFDRVCKKHNIRYFLSYGALLGAVRDGHSIPWDDDIDVVLLRKDYDRLLKVAVDDFKDPYFLQSAYTDIDYPRGHAQLRNSATCCYIGVEGPYVRFNQGMFIDIFVLDGIPDDPQEARAFFDEKDRLIGIMKHMSHMYHPKKWMIPLKRIRAFFLKRKYGSVAAVMAKLEKLCRRYTNTKYVDIWTFRWKDYGKVRYLPRSAYDESTTIEFEGYAIPTCKDYLTVLEAIYGEDYMTPKQIPNEHELYGGIHTDPNRSFTEVLHTHWSRPLRKK